MNDFWKSYDITHAELGPNFRCYPLYGKIHLIELALSLVFIVGMALWYRRSSASARRRILVGVTIALLADEAALLVLYPVLLVVRGYRPSARRAPQVLAFLFGSALPIYFLNKPLNTNFYFLNNPYGNVITSAFTRLLGEKYYILGFLPAIAVALCLMYLPWVVADARHKKRK